MSNRKEELLAAARERLTNEKNARDAGAASAAAAGPEILYRGQVVRQTSAGVPGSGLGKPARQAGGSDDVRAALQKVKELYHDGLISRVEAEKKRSESWAGCDR